MHYLKILLCVVIGNPAELTVTGRWVKIGQLQLRRIELGEVYPDISGNSNGQV